MKYEYDVIRTAAKNISIHISDRNKITVRCPYFVSVAKMDEFVTSKSKWIEKVVERNALRLAVNDDVIEHRKIYVNGVRVPLIISDENKIAPDAVYVKDLQSVEKLYCEQFSEGLKAKVKELSEEMMLYPNSVSVKDYTGRWGCCDAANNLIFNYKIFMLPPEIQRYVMVHEICHVLCHNHSSAFWKLVSDYQPNWKFLRDELKNYDFLTTLY